jgi:hypothetical protein
MMLKAWNRLVKIVLMPDEVMGRTVAPESGETGAHKSASAKPLEETASR